MKAFISLKTTRLTLRRLSLQDVSTLAQLRSHPAVNKFLDRKQTTDEAEAAQFITMINDFINQKKSYYWAICIQNNPKLIGTICLWNFSVDHTIADIGYELFPDFQKQGFMAEALLAVIDFARNELRLNSIQAYTHCLNFNSIQLLQKSHFQLQSFTPEFQNPDEILYLLSLKNSDID